MIKKMIRCIALLLLFPVAVFAMDSFIVQKIEFRGLQRISRETALHYVPIKIGQRLTGSSSAETIQRLYATGFFESVNLAEEGNTLIIIVEERLTISNVSVKGNKLISKDKMNDLLKSLHVEPGQAYNPSILESIRKSLLEQYRVQSRYNATVTVTTKELTRGRVEINIVINEGKPLKIKSIEITGNHAFSKRQLSKAMKIATDSILEYFSERDQYSKEKFDYSLELLRFFYYDHGYIDFKVESYDAQITPDNKYVAIKINVNEGDVYHVKGYQIVGKQVVPISELKDQLKIKLGDVFSRTKVVESNQAIARRLSNDGYAYPLINAEPKVDKPSKEVFLVFNVDPGKRFYVRRINYKGNYRTSNIVMRREMRQFEAAVFNGTQVQESTRRLKLLGYFKTVDVQLHRVPNVADQLDLDFNVNEVPGGQVSFGVGYSSEEKFLINASLKQNNFFGTGNTFDIDFQRSRFIQSYSMSYNNPYYTVNGVSRGYTLYYLKTDPRKLSSLSRYALNQVGAELSYGFPISNNDNDRLVTTFGVRHLQLQTSNSMSQQIASFVRSKGRDFQQATVSLNWLHNGLDQTLFPTSGLYESLNALGAFPMSSPALSYYRLDYFFHWYQPLYRSFILTTRGEFGYGNGFGRKHGLPFFENFFAGGLSSVRGYQFNTLGPRDSLGDAIGANTLIDGSIGLIVPNPIHESLRTTVFFDMGNVYQLNPSYGLGSTGLNLNTLGYSVGLGVEWQTGIAPLTFSVARALNRGNNKLRWFDFTIGTSI